MAAMRRLRYEFKSKSIKKRKVVITISIDGKSFCAVLHPFSLYQFTTLIERYTVDLTQKSDQKTAQKTAQNL